MWSDLHLGHAKSISAFGRPHRTPEEMDDQLFDAWWRAVDSGDTIVNLGDLTPGGLSGRRLKRLRAAPGRKVLVLGNHEFTRGVDVGVEGFDEVYSSLFVAGSPALLLTHIPLRRVPPGCVSVHGHLHDDRVRGSLAHINVSIEQLAYQPRRLADIRRLAAELAAGRMLAGRTTARWLEELDEQA